ncbi:DUF4349 domain-containing protein [Pedobacter sp. BS3]|uniref:DUF4349 domain-containing protein n=1 Tax=Pedobacter sp. BS3 TaxID=2567937 RepID=UPI0011ED9621|nr:DUF4349 domain-containing protein [Pedobacter sp. BS3]TZF81727.1 DUF4349 domain-containing protein [Pedobacter sp. BS3]
MKKRKVILWGCMGMLLYACSNGNKSAESINMALDTMAMPGDDSVKLVKTAGMDFKVSDVNKTSMELSGIVRQNGGLVTHKRIETVENGSKHIRLSADSLLVISSSFKRAEMTVRIPSEQLEDFMYRVGSLAKVIWSSNLDVDDKGLDYLSSKLKQKNYSALPLKPGAVNKASDAVTAIDKQNENVDLLIANKRIDAAVQYSTLQLNFSENALVHKETIANTDLSDYNLPFLSRVGQAFVSGLNLFETFIVACVHLWLFIITGILVWFIIRKYKGKGAAV